MVRFGSVAVVQPDSSRMSAFTVNGQKRPPTIASRHHENPRRVKSARQLAANRL
jgi:hypothetical protein